MFRRTSSCHQDFTPPPPPSPCGSEGQKATVCCPVVVQLLPTTRPPARTRRSRRRHTASDRIEAQPAIAPPSSSHRRADPLVAGCGFSRPALLVLEFGRGKEGFLPRVLCRIF